MRSGATEVESNGLFSAIAIGHALYLDSEGQPSGEDEPSCSRQHVFVGFHKATLTCYRLGISEMHLLSG